jgi:bisphosphoglycerate-dependent phosphoglycerate mutase
MNNGHRVVIVRHGESIFNAENRFTGWIDCGLTGVGVQQVQAAGALLRQSGFAFDRIYTSVLSRCTESARIIGEALSQWGGAATMLSAFAECRRPIQSGPRPHIRRCADDLAAAHRVSR